MTDAPRPAPPAWKTWTLRGVLLVGYASLFLVSTTVSTKTKTVRAERPDLGVIKLVFGKGPSGVKGWVAHFNLDVPVDKAWAVLGQCENLPKVLKGVASCKLISSEGNVKVHRMTLTHPENAYMKTRTVYDVAHHRTRWKMVDGSFVAAEGGISLAPHPKYAGWTRVEYAYFLNISKMLPVSFEIPRVRRSVRRMAREIQRYFSDLPVQGEAKRPAKTKR